MIIFVKDGLQTINLADNGNNLEYVKSRILGNSYIYTDVEGGFNLNDFEANINAHSNYNIDSLSQLNEVASTISSDL